MAGVAIWAGAGTGTEAIAAPKAELWERWQAYDAGATARIDHGPWDRLVRTYLTAGDDGVNRFDYGAVSAADAAALEAYIESLAGNGVSRLSQNEQLALWINLYNALTVKVVLDHFPVESIRDIDLSPGLFSALFSPGPWEAKLVTIEGETVSLNDIEHRILRPIWRDPRLHYALNCASLGCPNLMAEAYGADTAERFLEEGARAYVNHPRGARVDNGRLTVSSLYVWYGEDFCAETCGADGDIIAHLREYAGPGLARALEGVSRISGDDYDWSLNDWGLNAR